MSVSSFLAGALAACGAVTFTNPAEVVKTRLQLQGELQFIQQKVYPNAFSAFYLICKNEGLRGIQKGLFPAYAYQILLNGTRLGLYEPMRNVIQSWTDSKSFWTLLVSGASTGVMGAFVSSPLFLVKTRMQSLASDSAISLSSNIISNTNTSKAIPNTIPNTNRSVGHQHTYVNKGLLYSLKHIYTNEGIKGLWRGVDASMTRTGIGSAVQLSSYDTCKSNLQSHFEYFENKDFQLHFTSSLITSLLVCLAMNPFDVASTRMYNQHSSQDQKGGVLYKNGFDCIKKTVKAEGIWALYKGLTAHYLRIGPHTILTFVFLEELKRILI